MKKRLSVLLMGLLMLALTAAPALAQGRASALRFAPNFA
jgi:hypothetical protein